MTGCLAPDNGAITVGSCDVTNNAEGARRVLAYCPYNGTLFDDLTVEEHLTFFGTVGVSSAARVCLRMSFAEIYCQVFDEMNFT